MLGYFKPMREEIPPAEREDRWVPPSMRRTHGGVSADVGWHTLHYFLNLALSQTITGTSDEFQIWPQWLPNAIKAQQIMMSRFHICPICQWKSQMCLPFPIPAALSNSVARRLPGLIFPSSNPSLSLSRLLTKQLFVILNLDASRFALALRTARPRCSNVCSDVPSSPVLQLACLLLASALSQLSQTSSQKHQGPVIAFNQMHIALLDHFLLLLFCELASFGLKVLIKTTFVTFLWLLFCALEFVSFWMKEKHVSTLFMLLLKSFCEIFIVTPVSWTVLWLSWLLHEFPWITFWCLS